MVGHEKENWVPIEEPSFGVLLSFFITLFTGTKGQLDRLITQINQLKLFLAPTIPNPHHETLGTSFNPHEYERQKIIWS